MENVSLGLAPIIEKWDKMFFLEKALNKRNTALACELLSIHLLDDMNQGEYDSDMDTIAFPMIMKVFNKEKEDMKVSRILHDVEFLLVIFNANYSLNKKVLTEETLPKFIENFIEDHSTPPIPKPSNAPYKHWEAKISSRFLVTFPKEFGIQQWVVCGCERPSIDITHDGERPCNPITIKFRDPMGTSTTERLMEINRSHYDKENIELYTLLQSGFTYILELLDPEGAVVERWSIEGCEIININLGVLDTGDSGAVICSMTLQPKFVGLLN